ncbi:Leucine-rich repeat-containing protein 46 [Batrachochytrium dendrobatidis]
MLRSSADIKTVARSESLKKTNTKDAVFVEKKQTTKDKSSIRIARPTSLSSTLTSAQRLVQCSTPTAVDSRVLSTKPRSTTHSTLAAAKTNSVVSKPKSVSNTRQSTPVSKMTTTMSKSRSAQLKPVQKVSGVQRHSVSAYSLTAKSAEAPSLMQHIKKNGLGPEIPNTVTLAMIAKRNIPNWSLLSCSELLEEMNIMTHVRLDNECIVKVAELYRLPRMTHLYLSRNMLDSIPNLDFCQNTIRFLILSHNRLKTVQGIQQCTALELLDLSDNQIIIFDKDAYPKSIEYLMMQNNPCAESPDFRLRVANSITSIREINQSRVGCIERRLAKHTFGGIEDILVASSNTTDLNGMDSESYSDESDDDSNERVLPRIDTQTNSIQSKSLTHIGVDKEPDSASTQYESVISEILDRSRQRQSEMEHQFKMKTNLSAGLITEFKQQMEHWITQKQQNQHYRQK